MAKIRVAVIFGGTNTEHEVSQVSGRSVLNNLDPEKYQVLPIYITKDNRWVTPQAFLPDPSVVNSLPGSLDKNLAKRPEDITQDFGIDVFFPVMHGPYGEDGTIQGLLEMMHVPYVGCGVLGSAICMDKDIQKQLCRAAGLPVTPSITLTPSTNTSMIRIIELLGLPLFVKPVNQGSSVGVTKIHTQTELQPAIQEAFRYDHKVLVETAVPNAREIECSVLGPTDLPEASVLGEVIPSNEFYDYDAKYIDGQSDLQIPAKLSRSLSDRIRQAAKTAFTVCNCYGLARIDFLLEKDSDRFYLSELNTMPGFTKISMYPKLWEASGVPYPKLIDKLIDLALIRHRDRSQITSSYTPKTAWHEA